jgi:membrane-bound lytic murein transglycosylase D
MTLRHHLYVLGSSLLALASAGCTTTKPQRFGMAFLPPPPKPAVTVPPLSDAPHLQSNVFLSQTPSFLNPSLQSIERPTPASLRIQRADERYRAGKELYQAGDLDGARREFDRAVDILMSAPDSMPERNKVEKRLEEMVASIHRYDVNGLGAGDLSDKLGYDKAPLEDILVMTFPVDPNLKPKVSEQVQLTSSQLPLQVNDAVLSYIHFFSGDRGHRTLVAGLKRSGKYRPMISRILAEERVPQELIYLAQAESGFFPRAVSNKAATGMWQFVQWRGREYGLNQTSNMDDRLDPEKATRSAARHLRDLYERFGDWYLAIAGYNCGPGNIEKAVERTGYADFWQLRSRNAIPKETTNYVPIILAMTIMAKNPKDYGIDNLELDQPLEYETTKLTVPTHMALVADVAERPVSEIRELNPALLSNVAPPGYELRIPKGTASLVLAGLEAVPEMRRASWRVHRVGQGETLASIAKQYNTPVSSIASANTSSSAGIGDVLVIPAALQETKVRLLAAKRSTASRGKTVAARQTSTRIAAKTPAKRTVSAHGAAAKPAQRKATAGIVQRASLR